MAFAGIWIDYLDLAFFDIDKTIHPLAESCDIRTCRIKVVILPASRNACTWDADRGVRCICRKSTPIVSTFRFSFMELGSASTRASWEKLTEFQG
jgi:hypothetical protein